MLFRRNMISTKLGNMECAKPTNTAAPPVQLRSPQYAANLRRLKRGGLLLCSSRPPNWSQHNFEYYGQQLRPSHPLIEGRLIVFDEMGLEICSSVLGQTRPTTLYIGYEAFCRFLQTELHCNNCTAKTLHHTICSTNKGNTRSQWFHTSSISTFLNSPTFLHFPTNSISALANSGQYKAAALLSLDVWSGSTLFVYTKTSIHAVASTNIACK